MEPTIFFLLIILLLIPAYQLLKSYNKNRRIAKYIDRLPGPKKYPIFGTSFELMRIPRDKFWQALRQRAKTYGPLYRSWYGTLPMVHLLKPEHMEVVMSSRTEIVKGPVYDYLRPLIGDGLLTSTGLKWHTRRKLITPAFHFSILEQFQEIFNEMALVLTEKFTSLADGKVVDIYPLVKHCVLDIFCETAMGVQINAMEETEHTKYTEAVFGINRMAVIRTHQPLLQSNFLFNLSKTGKKFNEYLQILQSLTRKVIQERKHSLKNNNKQTKDMPNEDDILIGKKKRLAFLDLLIDASEDGKLLSDDDLQEEVNTFMFEGHDTTAASICWCLFMLANHPEIQERVAQELDEVFQGKDRPVTMRDLSEMKYLERVIKETLRIYPSTPNIMRTLSNDITLDGQLIPAGCAVLLQIYDVHRDERYFKDPERFDPDRFLPENCVNRHAFAYVPFSGGPRNCIGQRFALNAEKTVLSKLLRKFKVKAVDTPKTVKVITELILRPADGMFLRLEPRNSS